MLEHRLSTHAHICLVSITIVPNTSWTHFLQQVLEAMFGNGKDKRSPRSPRAQIDADALTSDTYYNLFKDLFPQSPLGFQPLSITVGPHSATRFKQVNALHLIKRRPLFQGVSQHHPQCVIQLNAMYSVLTQLRNEHMILLGIGKDKNRSVNV